MGELIDAINTANSNGQADRIFLDPSSTYSIVGNETGIPFTNGLGNNAFPIITSDITIEGNGASLIRFIFYSCPNITDIFPDAEEDFRFFQVESSGILTLNNITLENGCGTGSPARGGAIIVINGSLILNGVELSMNQTPAGGGGGAVFNNEGNITVDNSLFNQNTASIGGGIWNLFGSVNILNSTFYGNVAGQEGGAIRNSEVGELIFPIPVPSIPMNITNSSFVNNMANEGGAVHTGTCTVSIVPMFALCAVVNFKNTILANNTAFIGDNCSEIAAVGSMGPDDVIRAEINDNGGNVSDKSGDDDCADLFNSDFNPNIMLGPLSDNGGPTDTIALLQPETGPPNPAIDLITALSCTDQQSSPQPVTVDQRGFPRPINSNCDSGAFEFGSSLSVCGNGMVEGTEQCDGGACCTDTCTFESGGTQCRASAGVCDVAEQCTGASAECPADGFDNVSQCRGSAGSCDVAEFCDGTGPNCPVDGVVNSGVECRATAGVCDASEVCDGVNAICPADGFATGGVCRSSAGSCDVEEICNGSGPNCPADGFASGGTECRASAGICDVAESCTGTGAACPADGFEPSSTECRASGGQCDIAENCTGAGVECPSDEKDSTTVCRASAGICDPEEICDGVGNDCPSDTLEASGTECRASAGFCDVAEECTGDSAVCPSDEFEPDTLECRASEGICDIAEFCTGSGALCPGDSFEPVTTSCRASLNSCDIEEFCDGSTAECPSDAFEELGTVCTADNGGPDGQCLRDPIVCVNQGLITIIKEADTPNEEDGEDFEFSCTDSTTAACADMGDENGMFFLDDPVIDDLDMVTDTETSDPMFIGEYTIEEMVPTGWQLDMIECVDDEDGETIADADAASVLINLDPDEEVMCTFFNSDLPINLIGFNNGTRMQVIKNRQNKVRITGITPGKNVKLAWGFKAGTSFISGGVCDGTEFSIRNHKIIATLRANDQGNLNKTFFVPNTSAKKAFIQPLDMGNCMVGKRKQLTLLND